MRVERENVLMSINLKENSTITEYEYLNDPKYHKQTVYDRKLKDGVIAELRDFWSGNEGEAIRNVKWALLAVVLGIVSLSVSNVFMSTWAAWAVATAVFGAFITAFIVKSVKLAKAINADWKAKDEDLKSIKVYARMTQYKETEEEAIASLKAQEERKKKEAEAKKEARAAMLRAQDNKLGRYLKSRDARIEKKSLKNEEKQAKRDERNAKKAAKTISRIQKNKQKSTKNVEEKELVGA